MICSTLDTSVNQVLTTLVTKVDPTVIPTVAVTVMTPVRIPEPAMKFAGVTTLGDPMSAII